MPIPYDTRKSKIHRHSSMFTRFDIYAFIRPLPSKIVRRLNMALGRRGPVPGLVHHSNRGSQYAGGNYRKLIKNAGLTQSMSRKG